ncbi:MAG TPA: hypothetical protein VIF62_05050 [Labilithrix sp.]
MNARRFRNAILLLGLAAGGALVGCELIVDFDRTKIPIEDAGNTADVTPPPSGDGASDSPIGPGGGDAAEDSGDSGDAGDAADEADAPDGD